VKLFKLICILFIVGLTSCSVIQYATVPVDYAPKLIFNPDTTHILLVNKLAFDSTKNSKRKIMALKAAAYTAVAGAEKQLKLLPGVKVTSLIDSLPFTVNGDSVKYLAKARKANYVLTLDDFNAGIVLDNVQYDGNAQIAYYNTKAKVDFTLYESNGIYFKKLKGVAEEPQDNGNRGFSINGAAREAALDALKDYLPYTITNHRPLYTGTDELESSVQQILKGKFDIAYKILNPLIDGKDLKLASKAAYNLAVVYEAQGDIDEALDLAKLSNKKQQNEYATVLIAELIKE
jgi:tetratricopeptide (TPR) repeat protein